MNGKMLEHNNINKKPTTLDTCCSKFWRATNEHRK